jgi:hypothetical protein
VNTATKNIIKKLRGGDVAVIETIHEELLEVFGGDDESEDEEFDYKTLN